MSNTERPELTTCDRPERIGPYRILEELGAGGMGTVFLGEHAETGHRTAVKVLPASMAREPGFVARFNREIEAMRQLNNSNEHIVELYDSGEDQGQYYYAMEYVPGETLTALLTREKRLPWREAIEIGVQICRALKSAHNAGIVHRDLKPSNLLIREDGLVKLTDFGVAQVFATSKLTVTGGILGTAEYMSPEQAQGRRASRQSDIYSLGAVLYVMLTGRPPFTGQTALEIAQKHKFSQFDSPRRIVPEIPHWLDEVVCKCLAKKPEDRFPDAYVLGLRLQEIPRKVELAESGANPEVSAGGETEVAGTLQDPQVVGGTILRDMMRAHIEAGEEKTPLGRWLDNVWVLAGLLVLLAAGSFWLFTQTRHTPEKLFAQGERYMQMQRGPAWDTAEAECFRPLLEMDQAIWGPRVQPYLEKIDRYQFERDLLKGNGSGRGETDDNEPTTILLRALDEIRNGQRTAAKSRLNALVVLLERNDEFAVQRELAKELIGELEPADEKVSRYGYLKDALHRASELEAEGDSMGATAIRQSIIDLYAGEVDAKHYVEAARQGTVVE